ncbi:stage III sporulation protein AF [Brevibacillus sp. H7]|uniref:stage III sporulation protein AF n=1 Tax=Brevibacillus sp. H7 TaxID=3349138 RepID=UPI0037F66CD6
MAWLTLWLKKIILLVLLAAFLDLILPNTSMQRYVKMVMGLIILLTIISPVFALFNLSQEELAVRLDRYQEELDKPPDQEWKRMTDKLLGQRDQQMTEYVKSQMEAAIRAQVKETHGVELSSVEVSFDAESTDQPSISRIELVIGQPDERTGKSVEPVKPIEPVVIAVGRSPAHPDGADLPAAAKPRDPLHLQIAEGVAREWGVEVRQVSVTGKTGRAVRQ